MEPPTTPDSDSSSAEPIYESVVADLGNPAAIVRELDELLIRWHLNHNPAVREE